MAGPAGAHSCGPAWQNVVGPKRRAHPVGYESPVQAGPMVEAVGELDARAFSCAFGSTDARDDSRSFCVGRTDAHGRRSGPRHSRNRGLGASL